MTTERTYVTTPIYYVNDRPHIGHAYTTILTDAIARWHRQAGRQTFFLTGTDEHGQKVQQAADKRGMSPQAHCDELHQAFKDLWPELHIEISRFIRTTEPEHVTVVQGVLKRLWDADLIYAKEYGGWYCVSEERFCTDKEVTETTGDDGAVRTCPNGDVVEWIEEKNYFFKMSAYQQQLIDWIEEHEDFIQPSFRRNEVLGFLREPLMDLCISRPKSRLSWGIELPFDTDYVTYVWFDALLNYLTGIGYPDGDEWQAWWAESHHLIGKDILTTHCVYWTTMLMAMEVPLPKSFVAHGWWLMGDSKMSKSKGNVVDPMALKDMYGVEVFRYYLLREMSVGQDASFSEAGLVTRNNTELANALGNLANRTLNMVEKRFGGAVPEYVTPDPADDEIKAATAALGPAVDAHVGAFRIHLAVEECMKLARAANGYLTETAPFRVVKTDPERAGSILRLVLAAIHEAARWLAPAMPQTMAELIRRVGVNDAGVLETGARVEKGSPLFPQYDMPKEEEPEPEPVAEAPPADNFIAFEDFTKVELRIGKVLVAEKVKKSNKLLRLEVDLGTEQRQVLAGIAQSYEPEAILGRRVVVVTNLKPRKIFGLESQGMILAAHDDGGLFVMSPDGEPAPGSPVS